MKSLWHKSALPLAYAARSFLGINGLSDRVDSVRLDLRNDLQELAARMRKLENANCAPTATPALHSLAANHELINVSPPGKQTYQLSIFLGEGDLYHGLVAASEAYDPNWYFLNDWIKPGDVFLDLGANIGTISIPAAVNGASVHAFELLDANVKHLARSVEANDLKQVSIVIGAVTNRHDYVGISGVSAWGSVVEGALISTPTIVIDHYVTQRALSVVNVMKIDVEGSEKLALDGSAKVIARDHPDILIECNAHSCGMYGYSYRELLRALEKQGYSLYRLIDRRVCPVTSEAPQELIFTDYLATIKTPEEITARSGWSVGQLQTKDVVDNIVGNERYGDVQKIYVVNIRDRLPDEVLADPAVKTALKKWETIENEPLADVLRIGSA